MILLDTHAWIWWLAQPESLSEAARRVIDAAVETSADGGGVAVSAISAWELATLAARGRLELTEGPRAWVERCVALPFFSFVPVDHRVALRSVDFGKVLHADPADRMIVATAIVHDLPLVTKDDRLRNAGLVPTVW